MVEHSQQKQQNPRKKGKSHHHCTRFSSKVDECDKGKLTVGKAIAIINRCRTQSVCHQTSHALSRWFQPTLQNYSNS